MKLCRRCTQPIAPNRLRCNCAAPCRQCNRPVPRGSYCRHCQTGRVCACGRGKHPKNDVCAACRQRAGITGVLPRREPDGPIPRPAWWSDWMKELTARAAAGLELFPREGVR